MPTTTTRTTALRHPVRFLVLCFCAWKLLLLLVALASPGHGYDTSTSLLLAGGHGIQLGHQSLRDDGLPDDLAERLREQLGLTKHPMNHTLNHNTNHNPNPLRSALGLLQPSGSLSHPEQQPLPPALHLLALKLTRWDAIYYVQAAARGYRYEQEWAFGWGFNRLIAAGAALAHTAGVPPYRGLESLVAVALAHTAHLLAVLVLFALTKSLFPRAPAALPLTAALLHLLSPAGLFLSAPYAESACALLSFAGCWFFAQSRVPVGPSHASSSSSSSSFSLRSDLLLVAAGVAFGMATTLRSNGILNGLLLLEEAFRTLHSLLLTRDVRWVSTRHLLATGFGGVCVAAGLLLPQSLAYMEFCAPSPSRPWCMRTLPSIYTFVQEHYWNVGLFRYWTLGNVPLFLLAAPMLVLMVVSAAWALTAQLPKHPKTQEHSQRLEVDNFDILRNLAVSQLILTLLTLTTAHVQIINRLSSAFPVWVWFLAMPAKEGTSSLAKNAVRAMVMYGVIQGALFSLFLPPA